MAEIFQNKYGNFCEYEDSCKYFEQLKRKISDDGSEITSMMDPEYLEFDFDEKTMTVRFIAKKWEMNGIGVMHGGMVASMLDHVAGCTACLFQGFWTPSVDISVKYISQVNVGDELICIGHVIHSGKRFITSESTLYNKTSGRIAGTLLGTYANGATNSSKKR